MQPAGFKKDSRYWLHKNPQHNLRSTEQCLTTGLASAESKTLADQQVRCDQQVMSDPWLLHSPTLITDRNGRVFKKDSRTWLHKSSKNEDAKSKSNGSIRVFTTFGSAVARIQGRVNTDVAQCRVNTGVTVAEIRLEARASGSGLDSLRKKLVSPRLRMSRPTGHSLDSSLVDGVKDVGSNLPTRKKGSSCHNITETNTGKFSVSGFTSECNVLHQENPAEQSTCYASTSSSASGDKELSHCEGHVKPSKVGLCTPGQYPDDGLKRDSKQEYEEILTTRQGIDPHRTLVSSRDGLMELQKMLQQHGALRNQRSAWVDVDDLALTGHDISPGSMSSGSLDACLNLSDHFNQDTNLADVNGAELIGESDKTQFNESNGQVVSPVKIVINGVVRDKGVVSDGADSPQPNSPLGKSSETIIKQAHVLVQPGTGLKDSLTNQAVVDGKSSLAARPAVKDVSSEKDNLITTGLDTKVTQRREPAIPMAAPRIVCTSQDVLPSGDS